MLAINSLPFMGQSTLKSYLCTRLHASLLLLVLLIVGQQSLNLWIEFRNQQAIKWVMHTLLLEREGQHLLNAASSEETSSLETYTNGRIAFRVSLKRLYNLVDDNPNQLKQLDNIKYLHDRVGRHNWGQKTLYDSLQAQVLILLEHEEIVLNQRKLQLQQLHYVSIVVNVLIIVLVLLVGLNLQLPQQIKFPLHLPRGDSVADEACQGQQQIQMRKQHLEDLICALSHDLRTPLLAIDNSLDGMIRGAFGSVSDTWKEVLQEYRQANKDLLKLVEVLLDVSRYEAGYGASLNYDALNWQEIFVKVITQTKATSKSEIAVNYNISPLLPTVYGDELEIRRVLQNLLDNAIRISEPNKEISLQINTVGKQVQVSVSDRGPGIAPHEKEQLFHRFIQGRGRRGSCGLGLYLCRQIIEAHRGSIGVESILSEGSTFWFTLPVLKDKPNFEQNK